MPKHLNPNAPKAASAVHWAVFPACCECGKQIVHRVSDAPIYIEGDDEPPYLIPRGVAAATARFLGQVNGDVRWDHIYQAIGSNQVLSHGIGPLRELLGADAVQCQRILKETRPGTYGAFSFASNIKVREPQDGEDDHGSC